MSDESNYMSEMIQGFLPQIKNAVTQKINPETEDERKERLENLNRKTDLDKEQLGKLDLTTKKLMEQMTENITDEKEDVEDTEKIMLEIVESDGMSDRLAILFQQNPKKFGIMVCYLNEVMEQENIYDDLEIENIQNVYQQLDLK